MTASDHRLIEIESKLAHQEYTVGELNDVVTQQQQQIRVLEQRVTALLQRVRELSDVVPSDGAIDETPPHY